MIIEYLQTLFVKLYLLQIIKIVRTREVSKLNVWCSVFSSIVKEFAGLTKLLRQLCCV